MSDAEDGTESKPPRPRRPSKDTASKAPSSDSRRRRPANSEPIDRIDPEDASDRQLSRGLRRTIATSVLIGVGVQILIADVVFVFYGMWGVKWAYPPQVITAWLAATVVQVVAVLLVITRSLFPGDQQRRRGGDRRRNRR